MDNKGQINIGQIGIYAVVGVVIVMIFAEIYAGLNTTNVSSSAVNLMNLIDLLLAATIVIGIVSGLVFVLGMRR